MSAPPRARREARAEEDGRAWADTVRTMLQSEGRAASGGWPGTISEARARVEGVMGAGDRPTPDERDRLARVLYHAARSFWLVNRDASVPDD